MRLHISSSLLRLHVSDFTVIYTASVNLTTDGGKSTGVIGPAPRCEAPVMAAAAFTGSGGGAPPTGNVTPAIASTNELIPFSFNVQTVCCFLCQPRTAESLVHQQHGIALGVQTSV